MSILFTYTMPNPHFLEEKPLTLVEVQQRLQQIQQRDQELGFFATKSDEYMKDFVPLSLEKSKILREKLQSLNLVRLKEEHIAKITDFLPTTINNLKIVLQAYPLSFPKKDQEAIVAVVKETIEN